MTTLSSLIKSHLIKSGWMVSGGFFIPPDERINWCAEWIPLEDGLRIPHWCLEPYTPWETTDEVVP